MTEEIKTTDELEAEYNALMQEKVKILRAEKEQREQKEADQIAAEEKKKADEAFNEKLSEALEAKLKEYGVDKPVDANTQAFIDDGVAGKKPEQDNKLAKVKLTELFKDTPETRKTMQSYHKYFCDNYEDAVSGTQLKSTDKTPYGFNGFLGKHAQANNYIDLITGQAFGADIITSWSPADIWCDLIWQAVKCKVALAPITLKACDINAGDGNSVQIRAVNNTMSIGSALGACECSTAVSSVFTTYTITLQRFDIYKKICNLDLFDVGYVLRDAIVEAVSQDFALGIDGLRFTALQTITPAYTETAAASFVCSPHMGVGGNPSYSCCSYSANLYQSILQLRARMKRAGYGQHGFYLILSHRVANYLKWKEGIQVPPWMASVIKMDGSDLVGIGNDIKVIEYCGAQDCTDSYRFKISNATAPTMAYLVDPDRAVGEAYGKRPSLKTDEDPIECDQLKLVMRSYVGINKLSDAAVGVIRNP